MFNEICFINIICFGLDFILRFSLIIMKENFINSLIFHFDILNYFLTRFQLKVNQIWDYILKFKSFLIDVKLIFNCTHNEIIILKSFIYCGLCWAFIIDNFWTPRKPWSCLIGTCSNNKIICRDTNHFLPSYVLI